MYQIFVVVFEVACGTCCGGFLNIDIGVGRFRILGGGGVPRGGAEFPADT